MRALSLKTTAQASDQIKIAQTTTHSAPIGASTRRNFLLGALIPTVTGVFSATASPASAVPIPAAPITGDCPDCIGEVNNTLNACSLSSQSCISTLNDDEVHFAAPWQFDDNNQTDAIQRLIDVATGGAYDPGLIGEPFGVSRVDAGVYIAKGVLAVLQNGEMPEQPKRQKKSAAEIVPFDGIVKEKRTTENGSEYIRILFGAKGPDGSETSDVEDPVAVIDAEFLFLKNDNIVNVRAASRVEPPASGLQGGELALSFTSGLVVDKNAARKKMELLRNAVRFDLAPVITDFDPRFNPETPLWLEKVFKPFDDRNDFKPSGVPYPVQYEEK